MCVGALWRRATAPRLLGLRGEPLLQYRAFNLRPDMAGQLVEFFSTQLTPGLVGGAAASLLIPEGKVLCITAISAQGCPAQSMQRFPLWTDAVLTLVVSCGNRPPAQLWRSDWVRHKYDSVRMYWVPHFGGACYAPNVLLSPGSVTFTATFSLPDGTPLGGDMAPWTGSNAPTVHIVGHLMPEEHLAGDLCAKRLHL